MHIHSTNNGSFWFGSVKNIAPNNEVELTIHVHKGDYPSKAQIESVRRFALEVDAIVQNLLAYLYDFIARTPYSRPSEHIKQMYFLTVVELKADNHEWWMALEPNYDVPTIYSFFPRFTIKDREIVWSNLSSYVS